MRKRGVAKILLLESATDVPKRVFKKYKKTYVFNGDVEGVSKLPEDILDMTDTLLSYYKAGKVIDKIFLEYMKSEDVIRYNDVFGDKRAYLYIKKYLLLAIGKIYLSLILAEKFRIKCGITENVDFIPRRFQYSLYELILKNRDSLPEGVRIPEWYLRKMRRSEFVQRSFYRAALIAYPVFMVFRMSWFPRLSLEVKHYRYGIRIWNSWISSAKYPYREDFLESCESIRTSNTLYIMNGTIEKENYQRIVTSGYDCCYFQRMVRRFSAWIYLQYIFVCSIKVTKILNRICISNANLSEICLKSLHWYIMWKIFYAQYKIDTCITFQDPGDLLGTIFQSQHDSRSIFIFTSTSYAPLPEMDEKAQYDSYYCYMIFDEVYSSFVSNNYLREQTNYIGKYIDCGVFRSDIVWHVRNEQSFKAKIKKALNIPQDRIVMGLFDTQMTKHGVIGNVDGCEILNSIYRFLETNANYFLVYKSRGYHTYPADSIIRREIDKLKSHARVLHYENLPYDYQPWELMGVCNLVVGMYTSSAPLESLAGGVKTIYYVPSKIYMDNSFELNSFPFFTFYNYEQFEENVNYWINRCTDTEYEMFKNKYIKKYIDSHCDGNARKRLSYFIEQYK